MYDFKRYTFPDERKKNSYIYGFFSILFILVIVIFTLIADKPQSNVKKIASSNLASVENKLIVDGLKMEDDVPPAESEGEIIFDDSFDDDIDITNIVPVETQKSKKKVINFNIEELRKKDKRWHVSKYTIQKNDNVWKIAKRYNTSYKLILLANNINNPELLQPGKMILVPNKNGVFHRINKGQSLISIARHYNVPLRDIIASNQLKDSDQVIHGQTIFVPDARSTYNDKKNEQSIVKKEIVKVNNRNKMNITLLWPVVGKLTSSFGSRRNPLGKGKQFHCGLDISCDIDTPVKAALDGTVIYSGWKDGYGNVVVLRHDNGYISVYGHNSKNMVQEGESVKKGQVIAKSGMTGSVTGAHLHFEFRKYMTPLNPIKFLKEK
ncbi:MAG: peptidoglycan DD-metalloendopeptidase family protein [Spirochaetes bacterium]|nr:peptidoglycan DD-metalloendopeptidase family protein [Spirochaetota bacterium]